MRKISVIMLVLLFLGLFTIGWVLATYNTNNNESVYTTIWVEGNASLTIDGELADWNVLQLTHALIEQSNITLRPNPPENGNDLSASLKCFADEKNVYVAIEVNDNELVFGQEIFGSTYNDDDVEIYFDGDLLNLSAIRFDENDGQINITLDENDETFISGRAPLVLEQFPYLWETLGVKGAIKKFEGGYTVEVAIPFSVLGWSGIEDGKRMGMNIRVYDDDDGSDYDNILEWAFNPDPTKIYTTTEGYNQIVFAEKVSMTDSTLHQDQSVSEDISNELEVVLIEPDQKNVSNIIYSVLNDLSNENLEAAKSKLLPLYDQFWALCMLSTIQNKLRDYEASKEISNQIVDKSSTAYMSLWARDQLWRWHGVNGDNEYFKNILETEKQEYQSKCLKNSNYQKGWYYQILKWQLGRSYLSMRDYVNAKNELKSLPALMKNNQGDVHLVLRDFERAGLYEEAINQWENIIQTTDDVGTTSKAQIAIARNYFFLKNYEKSKQICEKLLDSDINSKIALDARMILLSIDRKASN